MTKQERIEELTEVIRKVQMENFRQSRSTYTSPEQIAKAICNAGYRKINCGENEVLDDAVNEAVDITFRGAVLNFVRKLKDCTYCDNCFRDGKWHRYLFLEDINDITKEFLQDDK